MSRYFVALICAVLLNAAANLLIKFAARQITLSRDLLASAKAVMTCPAFLGASKV